MLLLLCFRHLLLLLLQGDWVCGGCPRVDSSADSRCRCEPCGIAYGTLRFQQQVFQSHASCRLGEGWYDGGVVEGYNGGNGGAEGDGQCVPQHAGCPG